MRRHSARAARATRSERARGRAAWEHALPAFLLWGIGLGILTLAVVAAAIAAVPAQRAGLASAIKNTARQGVAAIGIVVAGAIAGPPGAATFLSGFHTVALGSAGLYLIAAPFALALIPGTLTRSLPRSAACRRLRRQGSRSILGQASPARGSPQPPLAERPGCDGRT